MALIPKLAASTGWRRDRQASGQLAGLKSESNCRFPVQNCRFSGALAIVDHALRPAVTDRVLAEVGFVI
jgi:hypothetical protein